MPVSFLSNEQRESYGRYTGAPSADDLARYFHLDDSDHALIAQKRGAHNRLGFAVQLGTLRYLGTFLESPLAVPAPVLHTLAKQLRIKTVDDAKAYSTASAVARTFSRCSSAVPFSPLCRMAFPPRATTMVFKTGSLQPRFMHVCIFGRYCWETSHPCRARPSG